jgi:RNA methyltransferase, TrmH family
MAIQITSTRNPAVKNLVLLQEKPGARKDQNLIVIEGVREVSLAISNGFELTSLFICSGILNENDRNKFFGLKVPECNTVSEEVFRKIAYREDSGGIVALARPKRLKLTDLILNAAPLILVLETIEKPGNLGALLRTADAANLDAVIVCDPQTDIFNPNAIRSSIGCIFTMQVVTATSLETISWLKKKNIASFATALTATNFYHQTDFRNPSAIIMGSEANGLSKTWLDHADNLIKIPMLGKIDSMNVSASAAIVIFEAKRQRNFK